MYAGCMAGNVAWGLAEIGVVPRFLSTILCVSLRRTVCSVRAVCFSVFSKMWSSKVLKKSDFSKMRSSRILKKVNFRRCGRRNFTLAHKIGGLARL